MASSQITVTGSIGPAKTLTAQVFSDVQDLDFQIDRQVLKIKTASRIVDIDMYTIATVTYTIATRVATVTVST